MDDKDQIISQLRAELDQCRKDMQTVVECSSGLTKEQEQGLRAELAEVRKDRDNWKSSWEALRDTSVEELKRGDKLFADLAKAKATVDGYEQNMPRCGACAETIICGDAQHPHSEDCPHAQVTQLRAELAEAKKQHAHDIDMDCQKFIALTQELSTTKSALDEARKDSAIVDHLTQCTAGEFEAFNDARFAIGLREAVHNAMQKEKQ